jgi:hypothetical protein
MTAESGHLFVTPAQAGVQKSQKRLDSRSPPSRGQASFSGNDSEEGQTRFFSNLIVFFAGRAEAKRD